MLTEKGYALLGKPVPGLRVSVEGGRDSVAVRRPFGHLLDLNGDSVWNSGPMFTEVDAWNAADAELKRRAGQGS